MEGGLDFSVLSLLDPVNFVVRNYWLRLQCKPLALTYLLQLGLSKPSRKCKLLHLGVENLKFFASQFKSLHSKKIQHAFRYYSHRWRTWSTCFIQASWRRYKRRKMLMALYVQENTQFPSQENSDFEEIGEGNESGESQATRDSAGNSWGATILASKFAGNTRKGVVKKIMAVRSASTSLKIPKLFKPHGPDFSYGDV